MKNLDVVQIDVDFLTHLRVLQARLVQELARNKIDLENFIAALPVEPADILAIGIKEPWTRPVQMCDIDKITINLWILKLLEPLGLSIAYIFTGKGVVLGDASVDTYRSNFRREIWRLRTHKRTVYGALNVTDVEIEGLDLFDLSQLVFYGFDLGYITTNIRSAAKVAA